MGALLPVASWAAALMILLSLSTASAQFIYQPSIGRLHPATISPFGLLGDVLDPWSLHRQALEAAQEFADLFAEDSDAACREAYAVKERIFRPSNSNSTELLLGVPEPCSHHPVQYVPMKDFQLVVDDAGTLRVSANLTSGHMLLKEYELSSWADSSAITAKFQANNILHVTIPDKSTSETREIQVKVEPQATKVKVEPQEAKTAEDVEQWPTQQNPEGGHSSQEKPSNSKSVQTQEAVPTSTAEASPSSQKKANGPTVTKDISKDAQPSLEDEPTELCPECKASTSDEKLQPRRREVVGSRNLMVKPDPEDNYEPQAVEEPFPQECGTGVLDANCKKAIEKDAVREYIQELEEEIAKIKQLVKAN